MWNRPFVILAALAIASNAFAAGSSPPHSTTPPGPPQVAAPGVVKAVVVRSWGYGSSVLVWDYLNANWSSYGTIPIFIDSSTLQDVPSVTLSVLENSGADVVIVSDPAGVVRPWTAPEIAALNSYADQGHPLIGTYALLQWEVTDNRALAPLWGLRPDLGYNAGFDYPAAPSAQIFSPLHCLFVGIVNPLDVGGFPYVQLPLDGSWDPADLAGATFLARSENGHNIVTEYVSGNHHAYYISYMPEYQSGTDFDATQYLYDAIVCNFRATPVARATWGRIKTLYR